MSNTDTAWTEGLRLIADALSRVPEKSGPVRFWWRDDDAAKKSKRLLRLLAIAEEYAAPICLAVIPGRLDHSLRKQVKQCSQASVAVHGWAHANRAPVGQPSSEFPAELPEGLAARDLDRGISLLRYEFADRLLPIFVPPWNRFAPEHYAALVECGYKGISAFARSGANPRIEGGLTHAGVNFGVLGAGKPTRLADITDKGKSLAAQVAAGHRGPFGVMTHHKAHTEEVWDFCRAFWEMIARHPNAKAVSAAEVFGLGPDPQV